MITLGFSRRHFAPHLPSDDDGEPSLCWSHARGEHSARFQLMDQHALPGDDKEEWEDIFGQRIEYNLVVEASNELVSVPRCSCKENCVMIILTNEMHLEALRQLRSTLHQKAKGVQDDVLFEIVKSCKLLSAQTSVKKRWSLCGQPVCRRAFCNLLGIGRERLRKLTCAATLKHLRPLADQRKYNLGNSVNALMKSVDVDAFFSFLYQYSAETLADADDGAIETTSEITHLLEYALGRRGDIGAQATIGLDERKVNRKWLPHMSHAELFDMYMAHGNMTSPKAGRKCFMKVWNERWSALLRIREVAQHARCETCALLCKTRRVHPEESERQAANTAYRNHLNRMFADRAVDARLTMLSTEGTCVGAGMGNRIVHLRIDGMDQAKFKCPRHLENSKMWGSVWRPTLHCVGCIVEGVLEMYVILDEDVKKDSNQNCSILSWALDKAAGILEKRGLTMPEFMSVTYDNTAREGKNQTVAKWLSWLVASGKFRSVQDGACEKGHTHNRLDQRFSIIATLLKRESGLQTPQQFVAKIKQHFQPTNNCELHVCTMPATFDWQAYFAPWDFAYEGIAATRYTPSVCHSKRFLRRKDLDTMDLPGWGIDVPDVFVEAVFCDCL